jgi:hypothetical protein
MFAKRLRWAAAIVRVRNDRVLSDGMLSGGVLRYCVLSGGVLSAVCLTCHFRRHLC